MKCNRKDCRFYSECSKWLDKKSNGKVTVYFIPAIPPNQLPEDCPVKKFLRGE